jgi:hypothetical protein
MVMTYDEPLDETSVPATTDYSVSGTSAGISSLVVSGSTVTHTMDDTIKQGETVLSTYTAGVNPVRDLAENNAANLVNQATTNNSTVPVFCDEYQAVYDAFETTPSDADAAAQNAYVKAGVDDGWWGVGDREFIFASHASGRDTNLDWFDPTNNAKLHTLVNAPAWVQYQGYTSNGTNSYGNANYDASVDGSKFKLLDACVITYIRTQVVNTAMFDFGSVGTANKIELDTKRGSTNSMSGAINGGLAVGSGAIPTASLGMYGIDINTTGSFDFYYDGTKLETVVKAETALANGDIFSMCRSNGGTPISFSTRQQSLLSLGGSLTVAQHLSKRNAFQTLMTYYGTQV